MTIKRQKNQTRLELGAALDISQARNLYESLEKSLKRKPPLILDAGGVERVDTAAIQVLAAFCHMAREKGLEVSWDTPSITLRRAAEMSGLTTILGMPA